MAGEDIGRFIGLFLQRSLGAIAFPYCAPSRSSRRYIIIEVAYLLAQPRFSARINAIAPVRARESDRAHAEEKERDSEEERKKKYHARAGQP